MIEVRIEKDELKKIKHDVTHSIRMRAILVEAGIPFEGVLITQGITHGVLQWHNEEGIDGDIWVIRWYDTKDTDPTMIGKHNWKKVRSGHGEAFTWAKYVLDEGDDL